mgnify:CR=1 FL=1
MLFSVIRMDDIGHSRWELRQEPAQEMSLMPL